MAALTYHLLIEQGADYARSIPVLDSSNQAAAVAGWTAAGQIRARPGGATVLHDIDLTPDGTAITLRIPAAVSDTWAFSTARYDVELVSPDELTTVRLLEGLVILRPSVSR